MRKRILVTGCAGFIGSNLLRFLHNKYDVVGVDNLSFGRMGNVPANANVFYMDIKDISKRKLQDVDVIIHAATANIIYGMSNPSQTIENNWFYALELFKKFHDYVINLSTASVYGNASKIPTPETEEGSEVSTTEDFNSYAVSKRLIEKYLRERRDFTTLRLSNVYGPWQHPENPYCGVVSRFLRASIKGEAAQMYGDGSQTRDFTYIDDVMFAIERAICSAPACTEINISSGTETPIRKVAEIIGNKWESVPGRKIDNITRRCLDISKAKETLGWEPSFTLEQGIELTKKWMIEEYGKKS